MDQIDVLGDGDLEAWCIHCYGESYKINPKTKSLVTKRNNDHVPSKCLLRKPYPPNLPTIKICEKCNASFSPLEEYTAAFLGATCEDGHLSSKSLQIFDNNNTLSDLLVESLDVEISEDGTQRIAIEFNQKHIDKVIEKNARGHFYYECNKVISSKKCRVTMAPINLLSIKQREDFEKYPEKISFPKIGTRLFRRIQKLENYKNGWILLQDNQYRYSIFESGSSVLVKSIIQETIATDVFWEDAFS